VALQPHADATEKLTTKRSGPDRRAGLVQQRIAFEASLEAIPFPFGGFWSDGSVCAGERMDDLAPLRIRGEASTGISARRKEEGRGTVPRQIWQVVCLSQGDNPFSAER
jgi:hypothetical protein